MALAAKVSDMLLRIGAPIIGVKRRNLPQLRRSIIFLHRIHLYPHRYYCNKFEPP
jgi:hypothetical protein